MGLVRSTFMCVLWGCLTFFSFSCQSGYGNEVGVGETLQDGAIEPRGKHRLQLLFPLLLRISTRLAALVSSAFAALIGIAVFVVFSKKAFIISLFALLLSLSGKYKSKGHDDIYIHKVNSYPEYNGEEHIHYHHREPLRYRKHHHKGNRPYKKWRKVKRNFMQHLSAWHADGNVQPFKPLPTFPVRSSRRTFSKDDEDLQQVFHFDQETPTLEIRN